MLLCPLTLQEKGLAGLRAAIVAAGYKSIPELVAAGQAADAAYRQQQQQEMEAMRQRQYEAMWQREAQRIQRGQQAVAAGNNHSSMCRCGNPAAKACPRGCCGNCCKRVQGDGLMCARHGS